MQKIIYILVFLFSSATSVSAQIKNYYVDELITQLDGGSCKYEPPGMAVILEESKITPPCERRQMFASFKRRHDNYQCIVDAAFCLAYLKEEANTAVPVLIKALKKYRNVYTGDGSIAVRSYIADALGLIGDSRAISPLIDILQTDEPDDVSPGASLGSPMFGTYQDAVMSALGRFGPEAKEAIPYIIPFLKTSNCSAAYALGKIGDSQSIPVLIEALNNPECYYVAAGALSEFGVKAKGALPALYQLRDSLLEKPDNFENNEVKEAIKVIEKTIR